MKQNYMVAVCDILGFKNLVNSTTLDQLVNRNIEWFKKSLYHSLHKPDYWPKKSPALRELTNHTHIGLAWFSDTIFLYTREDTDEHCHSLISTIAWLLFETTASSGNKTRLRVGVAYGEAYMDFENQIYMGKPIIEADALEKAQNWIGGALTKSAEERVPDRAKKGELFDWFLSPYDVPTKTNFSSSALAINWPERGIPPIHEFPWSIHSPEPSAKDWQEIPDQCWKWKNTAEFCKTVCRK